MTEQAPALVRHWHLGQNQEELIDAGLLEKVSEGGKRKGMRYQAKEKSRHCQLLAEEKKNDR